MNMKQRLVEMMSEIEAIQRQLGWVVDTEVHKEQLRHPITEYHVNHYAYQLARLKDNLNTHGPARRCYTCNDSGWVENKVAFGFVFSVVNNPCSDCDKGREIKKVRDEKNRKAKEEDDARQEQIRLAKAQELDWRIRLIKVCVDDVIEPCIHLLGSEAINMLYKEYEYLFKRCGNAENWYQSEQYHLHGKGDFSIPKLWEKEARLNWVRETIPFGLKAHEDYYVIESNLLLKVAHTKRDLEHRIYQTLPAYANSDVLVEGLYKQLQELVAQVLSEQKNTETN
jgi:hypothetical protein